MINQKKSYKIFTKRTHSFTVPFLFFSGILYCFITILCWKRKRSWKWLPWLCHFLSGKWIQCDQNSSSSPLGNKLLDTLNKPNLCGWLPSKEQGGWKPHPRKETPAGSEGRHTPRTVFTAPTFRWVSSSLLLLWGEGERWDDSHSEGP